MKKNKKLNWLDRNILDIAYFLMTGEKERFIKKFGEKDSIKELHILDSMHFSKVFRFALDLTYKIKPEDNINNFFQDKNLRKVLLNLTKTNPKNREYLHQSIISWLDHTKGTPKKKRKKPKNYLSTTIKEYELMHNITLNKLSSEQRAMHMNLISQKVKKKENDDFSKMFDHIIDSAQNRIIYDTNLGSYSYKRLLKDGKYSPFLAIDRKIKYYDKKLKDHVIKKRPSKQEEDALIEHLSKLIKKEIDTDTEKFRFLFEGKKTINKKQIVQELRNRFILFV